VDAVLTGENVKLRLRDHPFDLIILDILLPGKNGIEYASHCGQRKLALQF